MPVKEYKELNHLKIIDEVKVHCTDTGYKVSLYEIIPIKEDNGIKYKHRKYQKLGKDLKMIKNKNNHYYYGSIKTIITNCHNTNYIIKTFKVNKYKIIKQ